MCRSIFVPTVIPPDAGATSARAKPNPEATATGHEDFQSSQNGSSGIKRMEYQVFYPRILGAVVRAKYIFTRYLGS